MLNLLRCEFAKLRRKPLFFAAAAVSALIPPGGAPYSCIVISDAKDELREVIVNLEQAIALAKRLGIVIKELEK